MAQGGLSQWLQRPQLQLGKMEPQQMEGQKCHQTHGPGQLSCPTTLPLAPVPEARGPLRVLGPGRVVVCRSRDEGGRFPPSRPPVSS